MRVARIVELRSPFRAPGPAVLRSVADELARRGNRIVTRSADGLEFQGPDPISFAFSPRRRAATLVSGGSVRIDPSDPTRKLRLELRFRPVLTYGLALPFVAFVLLVRDIDAGIRAMALGILAIGFALNFFTARGAYETWVAEGAQRAGPP